MNTDALVVLRGGVSVPAPAYVLLLDFEARGIAIGREGDPLIVQPADRLTLDDDRVLRALKPSILTLLDYYTRADLDAHMFSHSTRGDTDV